MASVVKSAWARAYETFTKDHALEDLQRGDTDEALRTWLDLANKELLDTQRSEEFLDAQRQLTVATTKLRARQSAMAEKWSRVYQMPTRTEVDDLTKIVHELRREVRSLKRELSNLGASTKGDVSS